MAADHQARLAMNNQCPLHGQSSYSSTVVGEVTMISVISRLVRSCQKCSHSASVTLRMDNLLCAMWSPKKKLRECHGYPARYVTIFTVQFALKYALEINTVSNITL